MRILVACEFSGRVRDAFIAKGHDAVSCDLLPTESLGPHYQGDVRGILNDGWNLMVAFPNCTYLCSSGLHWNIRRPERVAQTEQALIFVRDLMNAPIEHIAIENPIGCISTRIRKPDQIIQPYQFGDPESKATCLWLKNLPKLKSTIFADFDKYRCRCGCVFDISLGKYGCPNCNGDYVAVPLWNNQTASGQNKLTPSGDRAHLRSITYRGIANAMADQWGTFITN